MKSLTEKQIQEILSNQEYYDGDYTDYIIGFERGFRKALGLYFGEYDPNKINIITVDGTGKQTINKQTNKNGSGSLN